MKLIEVTSNVSIEDVAERIQYFSDRAHEIEELQKTSVSEAKREYVSLYNEQENEYNQLRLARNQSLVDEHDPLRIYHNYFGHLHFISNLTENLQWNLKEFDQGKLWFERVRKHIGN